MPSEAPDILVIEDDPGIRDTLAECLTFEGYSVEKVSNGAEALEYLERWGAPKLVVLDLVMPVMNGSEFLRRMRSRPALARIPVVLMTAAVPPPAGIPLADVHLPKPFELATLLDAVSRYCGPPPSAARAPAS